ncbi:MAG: hypothetical protein IKJ70_02330 [Clostridia bacterium]|nr:hypothetical protein [Clostridia bacterium]
MANITENYKAVIDGLSENLTKLGFTKCGEEDLVTRYQSEKGVVAVVLKDNIISLMGGEDLENVNDTPKKLAASLFEETADAKDIKYVVNEFADTLEAKYGQKKAIQKKAQANKGPQTVSKAQVKNGSFYDPNTLASKLCLVFPELRDPYKATLAEYGEFYAEEFFSKYGTEKVIAAIKENNPATMKKLFQVLNEIYEDGTNETQSVIAVTILGELNNDQILLARCVDYMSATMAPPVIEVNKYLASMNGKKAKKKLLNPPAYKPKKKKKQSAFMRAMNESMAQSPIQ